MSDSPRSWAAFDGHIQQSIEVEVQSPCIPPFLVTIKPAPLCVCEGIESLNYVSTVSRKGNVTSNERGWNLDALLIARLRFCRLAELLKNGIISLPSSSQSLRGNRAKAVLTKNWDCFPGRWMKIERVSAACSN